MDNCVKLIVFGLVAILLLGQHDYTTITKKYNINKIIKIGNMMCHNQPNTDWKNSGNLLTKWLEQELQVLIKHWLLKY